MRPFTDIRRDAHRLYSDFSAGRMSLDALEVGVAELLRQRAGCDAVALWRRAGHGIDEELRSKGPSHRGVIDDASGRPAPVPSIALSIYLAWMRSAGYLTHDSRDVGEGVIIQAWHLHCSSAVAFLHVPTFYNGELCGVVCFSDHSKHLAWPGPLRQSIQELISLVMIYLSPPKAVTRRTDILPRQTGCERHGSGTI
jgi:hypothetical protein